MLEFPIGSVSVKGNIYEDYNDRFYWTQREMNPKTTTKNPVTADAKSLANGKLKFRTYCAVCHGEDQEENDNGFAKKPVNDKGMLGACNYLFIAWLFRWLYFLTKPSMADRLCPH